MLDVPAPATKCCRVYRTFGAPLLSLAYIPAIRPTKPFLSLAACRQSCSRPSSSPTSPPEVSTTMLKLASSSASAMAMSQELQSASDAELEKQAAQQLRMGCPNSPNLAAPSRDQVIKHRILLNFKFYVIWKSEKHMMLSLRFSNV